MAMGSLIYPNIYYKLHPFVVTACDEMDMHGIMMPTKQMIKCICNQMCEKMFKVYPEMVKYDMEYAAGEMDDPPPGYDQYDRHYHDGYDYDDYWHRYPGGYYYDDYWRWYPGGYNYDVYSSSSLDGTNEFGHRGPFRDFLAFLLLTEFFRRRRMR